MTDRSNEGRRELYEFEGWDGWSAVYKAFVGRMSNAELINEFGAWCDNSGFDHDETLRLHAEITRRYQLGTMTDADWEIPKAH